MAHHDTGDATVDGLACLGQILLTVDVNAVDSLGEVLANVKISAWPGSVGVIVGGGAEPLRRLGSKV